MVPAVWPLTPGEWSVAALRFLVNARMLRYTLTPATQLELRAGIEYATRLVQRNDADHPVEAVELSRLYALILVLESAFAAARMPRAGHEAGRLGARYRRLMPPGDFLLPHPAPPEFVISGGLSAS